jgi:hypothetical protein
MFGRPPGSPSPAPGGAVLARPFPVSCTLFPPDFLLPVRLSSPLLRSACGAPAERLRSACGAPAERLRSACGVLSVDFGIAWHAHRRLSPTCCYRCLRNAFRRLPTCPDLTCTISSPTFDCFATDLRPVWTVYGLRWGTHTLKESTP